jgi:hypothetical protein
MATNNIKWGPVGLLMTILTMILVGSYMTVKQDRLALSEQEVQLLVEKQYALEKEQRLHDLTAYDDRLVRLESLVCELGEDNVSLKKTVGTLESQLCILRTTNKPVPYSSGLYSGKGGGSASTSTAIPRHTNDYIEINGKLYRRTLSTAPTYTEKLEDFKVINMLTTLAKTMNKADARQMAAYYKDPNGGNNILYYDTRKKMFTYLYPIAKPKPVVAEPVVKSKTTSPKKEVKQAPKKQLREPLTATKQQSLTTKIRG